MEVIPGKRQGTSVYVCNGYSYHKDKRSKYIYRCSKRTTDFCKAVLSEKDEDVKLLSEHNHPSEPHLADVMKLKNEMKEICRNGSILSNKEVFDQVCCKNPSAAVNITYNELRSPLHREKVKCRPSIPGTLHSLHEVLHEYQPMSHIYKGQAVSDIGEVALLFSTDKLLEALSNAEEIYADGTFAVVPKKPKIAQLYTVHIRYLDTGIATVFILCETKTVSLYKAIWAKIVELAPGLQTNIRRAMCDYERAAIRAISEQFSNIEIHGCWFHYKQAILRKWKKFNFVESQNKILSMVMTIPLLPVNLFPIAMEKVKEVGHEISCDDSTLSKFIEYVEKTWFPIAAKVSVHNCPIRTNNIVESFYKIAKCKLGGAHSCLWTFLDKLTKLINNEELDFSRLILGQQVRRPRSPFYKKRFELIKNAEKALNLGTLPLKQFLLMFTHIYKQQQYDIESLCEDVYLEEEKVDDCLQNKLLFNQGDFSDDDINETFLPERRINTDSDEITETVVSVNLQNILSCDYSKQIDKHSQKDGVVDSVSSINTHVPVSVKKNNVVQSNLDIKSYDRLRACTQKHSHVNEICNVLEDNRVPVKEYSHTLSRKCRKSSKCRAVNNLDTKENGKITYVSIRNKENKNKGKRKTLQEKSAIEATNNTGVRSINIQRNLLLKPVVILKRMNEHNLSQITTINKVSRISY